MYKLFEILFLLCYFNFNSLILEDDSMHKRFLLISLFVTLLLIPFKNSSLVDTSLTTAFLSGTDDCNRYVEKDSSLFITTKPIVPYTPSDEAKIFPVSYNTNFTKYYFRNLYNGMPYNQAGDCGYTALGMLLSFYTSYLSPTFIPTKYWKISSHSSLDDSNYEYNSPGVYDEGVEMWKDYRTFNSSDFKKYIEKRCQINSFNAYLYQIAIDAGILDLNSSKLKLSVNYQIETNLINAYLASNSALHNVTLKSYFYSKNSNLNDEPNYVNSPMLLKQKLINILKTGQPVIVGGYYNEKFTSGHVAVAYEYDETNNIIYVNNGMKNRNQLRYDINDALPILSEIYYFDIDESFAHEHSYTYPLHNGMSYCSCELKSHNCPTIDYLHKCNCLCPDTNSSHSVNTYNNANLVYHVATCECGKEWWERHTLNSFTKYCKYCGYFVSGGVNSETI